MTHADACQLAAAILRRMADLHERDQQRQAPDPERDQAVADLREIADGLEPVETT